MSDKFTFGSAGLIHELEMGMDRAGGYTGALVKKLSSADHLAHVREYLLGRANITPISCPPNILTVDRSIAPSYPFWTKEVMHPEFENTGPIHLDPRAVILYFHPTQKKGGRIDGKKLWGFLKDSGLIEHCLDIRVREEFERQPHLFQKEWKGKMVLFWKSVVLDTDGKLRVPFMLWHVSWSRVDTGWHRLDDLGRYYDAAALSAS